MKRGRRTYRGAFAALLDSLPLREATYNKIGDLYGEWKLRLRTALPEALIPEGEVFDPNDPSYGPYFDLFANISVHGPMGNEREPRTRAREVLQATLIIRDGEVSPEEPNISVYSKF